MEKIDLEEQILNSELGDIYRGVSDILYETIDELSADDQQKLRIHFAIRFLQEIWLEFLDNTNTLLGWKE